jgi:FolB domain-containing protein|tara:strand:+ start:103 stop:450 length:348 start_codon:yes stop_codon:yes gene_type:complete
VKFLIEIKDMSVHCIIGVYDEERLKPQELLITIKCQINLDENQDLDNIDNVTSYADLKSEITDFVSSSKYKTLEKLITELQKVILKKFPIEIQLLEINKIVIAKKYNAQKVSISI